MLNNRYDFMFLLQAVACNYNGDPDMANDPRTDEYTGKGIITDCAIKRRIRNYIDAAFDEPHNKIAITQGINMNKKIAEAVINTRESTIDDAAAKYLCNNYYDVRTFGGVLSTGLNAGQITGPVQISVGFSEDPVEITDMTVTRMAYTEGKFETLEEYDELDEKTPSDKKRTMGDKKIVPYALFKIKGSISANLANKTGFTEEDLNVLFEAIMQMYNNEITSSKHGMSVVGPLIIFKHVGTQDDKDSSQNKREALFGCAPNYKLYDMLKIWKKDGVEYPRDYTDYNFSFNMKALPQGVEVGLKYMPFSPIEWHSDPKETICLF